MQYTKPPQSLTHLAEFVGKYFEVYEHTVTTKNRWCLIVKALRGHLIEIVIDPFDIKNEEHLLLVIDKISEAVTNHKDSGLII